MSGARASHRNSSSWCSRGGYFCYSGATGEETDERNITVNCEQFGGKRRDQTPVAGIWRWQVFCELGSRFERCLSAEKKRSFSKLKPKKSSLVQDVGLRQRGLGGIPVEAVSGTCNNHRAEKVSRVAALSEKRVGVEMFSFFLSLCVFVFLTRRVFLSSVGS